MEVWHGTEISEADGAESADFPLSATDGDHQERRLDCVVRTGPLFSPAVFSQGVSVLEQIFQLITSLRDSVRFDQAASHHFFFLNI